MRLMHFTNEDTEQEYVTFTDTEPGDHDHASAENEYARPGFKLKGAWDIEPERLSKDYGMYFMPAEGDVYLMDR